MSDIAVNPITTPIVAPAEVAVPKQVAQERRSLIKAVKQVNRASLYGDSRELSFAFDRDTQKPVMRIVDRKTREVIQQIPAEYVLRMAEELSKE